MRSKEAIPEEDVEEMLTGRSTVSKIVSFSYFANFLQKLIKQKNAKFRGKNILANRKCCSGNN